MQTFRKCKHDIWLRFIVNVHLLFLLFFFSCVSNLNHTNMQSSSDWGLSVILTYRVVFAENHISCGINSPLIISEFLPRRTPEKEDRDKQEVLHRGDTVSTQLSILHQNFKSSNRDHYRVTKGSENMCRITLCVQWEQTVSEYNPDPKPCECVQCTVNTWPNISYQI